MKTKKIVLIGVLSVLLIIGLNVILLKNEEKYIYHTFNNLISNLIEKYPEEEIMIINTIKKGENKEDILKKYGINTKTLNKITSFKTVERNTIMITSLTFVIIISGLMVIYGAYSLKIRKEIKTINEYLQEILKGTYDLNIADYNEDEISILKNDIYKVTMKLKELSEYEKKEQIYLMNTLEDISHQLKTPLTALMVTSEILKNNDLTKEERNEFLNKETKELEKMEWLITTLLKYSKLDSGSVKLKREKIASEELITSILDTLSIGLELKEINVTLEDLDFTLYCDINWTKEAFTNIIKNAYEHLKKEGTITITGENNPLYQAISITDNGPGIPPKELKNIFKRFYTTNTAKNSVGIGLNMAKLILEKQGIKLECTSEVNRYTTFKIIFPKKKENVTKLS